MTVFYTSNHDMSLVSSPSEQLPTEQQLKAIEDAIKLSESTELGESELDCDSWVDDMMMGIIEDIQY